MATLKKGEVDGAALTLDEMTGEGVAASAVLVFDVSLGADVVLARTAYKSLAELKGKAIAVEGGALMLSRLLDKAGVLQTQVTVVSFTVDKHQQAWRDPAIDVLITYEPTATQLELQGAQQIFDSRHIPNTIFDVLAMCPEAATLHKEALRGLLHGFFAPSNSCVTIRWTQPTVCPAMRDCLLRIC
jgi:NitT/TauT family transport system substrate-binding protein